MKTMYPGMVNSPITEINAAITAAQTSITVLNGASLPAAPNLFVIGQGELAETVLYTAKSANTISGLTRGLQGTARAWPSGTKLSRNFTAYDHDAFKENIEEINAERAAWNAKETPAGAQTKVDSMSNIKEDTLPVLILSYSLITTEKVGCSLKDSWIAILPVLSLCSVKIIPRLVTG